jgi:hypothetical protein
VSRDSSSINMPLLTELSRSGLRAGLGGTATIQGA